MYIKKLSFLCFSVLLLGSSFVNAYHRSFENKTQYPLYVTIDRVGGGTSWQEVEPGEKVSIGHGLYAIDWVEVQAEVPGRGYEKVLSEQDNIGGVSLDYVITCQYETEEERLPEGEKSVVKKIKFILSRKGAVGRPGGIVDESDWFDL